MRIVGGIYIERSVFPESDVLYGSGGRAAAVLSKLNPEILLTSYVGEDKRRDIAYHAERLWDVELDGHEISKTVTFTYYHGLSAPVIRPTLLLPGGAPTIEIDDDIILQFGMLEGMAVVRGNKVVFDPQNPEKPELFDANGSEAKTLSYVLNQNEARKISKSDTNDGAAEFLLRQSCVQVVVIKGGAFGATVYTSTSKDTLAAYRTETVWPIGSGDVFAAVFAHFWAVENESPVLAAKYASRGAALYCGKKKIPLERNEIVIDDDKFVFPPISLKKKPSEVTIYLAGPFFTMGQVWLVDEARTALQGAGFKVFSPFHDVGIGDADTVVPKDIQGIEEADAMFALCDGLDAGTLFEIGYAVKKNIPVIAFGEQTSDEAMKMLVGTGCHVYRDFVSAIYQIQWEALA